MERDRQTTIIFDFDGTLADSFELVFNLYNEHVDEYGYLPLKKAEIPSLWKMGYKKAMKTKNIKFYKVPRIVMNLGRKMQQRMDEVPPYEGVIELLYDLREQGYSIGVLTSNQASLVKDFFTKHQFPPFDFVVSERTLFGKHKALKRIIKRFGLEKDQVVYVGDEPRDVDASRKAGVQVIGVTWGLAGSIGFDADHRPDFTASTVAELKDRIVEATK